MKTRDYKGDIVTRKLIIFVAALFAVVAVGSIVFTAVHATNERGTSEVGATVRLADRVTEDEIAVVPGTVTKKVGARAVILNRTSYILNDLSIDSNKIVFADCELAGTYATRECTSETGTSYWVTLTDVD